MLSGKICRRGIHTGLIYCFVHFVVVQFTLSSELSSFWGNLLERQILDPISDLLNQELRGWDPAICLLRSPSPSGALFLKGLLACSGTLFCLPTPFSRRNFINKAVDQLPRIPSPIKVRKLFAVACRITEDLMIEKVSPAWSLGT